jgi:xylulokinase
VQKTLGLDIGSTSIKAAVLDLSTGKCLRSRSLPFPAPLEGLSAGEIEMDPTAVIETVVALVNDLGRDLEHDFDLWVCGQMGGLILADDRGLARSNYISWRDVRSTKEAVLNKSYLDRIRDRWPEPIMMSLGRELQAGSTSALLYCLEDSNDLIDGVMPLSISDFVISQLCRQPGRMHVTTAIGLLDLTTNDWHYKAMEKIGLGDLWWPELIQGIETIGVWKNGSRTIRVHGAFGDHQTALYGAGLGRRQLSVNISTGSQVSMRTSKFQSGQYQTRCYFENDWINTITHLPAGRSLNALVDLFTELFNHESIDYKQLWQRIAEKVENAIDSELQANIAFYAGPLGSAGSLTNLTTDNLTVGNIFLASCRAMANNYFAAASKLDATRSWEKIVLSGGLTQALPRLTRLLEEQFSVPIQESVGEDTLLGLLKLAQSHLSSP